MHSMDVVWNMSKMCKNKLKCSGCTAVIASKKDKIHFELLCLEKLNMTKIGHIGHTLFFCDVTNLDFDCRAGPDAHFTHITDASAKKTLH